MGPLVRFLHITLTLHQMGLPPKGHHAYIKLGHTSHKIMHQIELSTKRSPHITYHISHASHWALCQTGWSAKKSPCITLDLHHIRQIGFSAKRLLYITLGHAADTRQISHESPLCNSYTRWFCESSQEQSRQLWEKWTPGFLFKGPFA